MKDFDNLIYLHRIPIIEKDKRIKNKGTLASIAEVLSSHISKKVYDKTVTYMFGLKGEQLITQCDNFDNDGTFMSMKSYYKLHNSSDSKLALEGHLYSIFKIFNEDFSELVDSLVEQLILDMFILNVDRCPRNYGLIFKETTTELVPAFDFDYTIYNWDRTLNIKNLSSKSIITRGYHEQATPFVGLATNHTKHKYSDLIDFCAKHDNRQLYMGMIEKNLDTLIPSKLLDDFEQEMDAEINSIFRRYIIQLLNSRRDAIGESLKSSKLN